MKLNLSQAEYRHLTTTNINAAFDHLEFLLEHPEEIEKIPNGAVVFSKTGDAWVDEQNAILAHQAQAKGETIYYAPVFMPIQSY